MDFAIILIIELIFIHLFFSLVHLFMQGFGSGLSSRKEMSIPPVETFKRAFSAKSIYPSPWVSYGLSYSQACAKHLQEDCHAKRVYVLASGSLCRNTSKVSDLQSAIESGPYEEAAVVGITKGIKSHSYYSDILRIIRDVKAAQADCIITLGAGSLTDAAKLVTFAIANNANTADHLETLYFDSPRLRESLLPAMLPIICIPTSLSAGEYTRNAGATIDETHHKHSFRHPSMGSTVVILDPELSKTTPERIWFSTGLKAVDHCVEAICSVKASREGNEAAERGLRSLLPGLLKTKKDPETTEPRLLCQLGAIDAISAALLGIPMGASHGIGHQLGPLGVSHGDTSCILLPGVCKWNARVNASQQQAVLDILWDESSVTDVLETRGLTKDIADLGDVLDALFTDLGMPRSLKDVGVARDKLQGLAKGSLTDRWCKTNPRVLEKEEHVMEILEMVFGE